MNISSANESSRFRTRNSLMVKTIDLDTNEVLNTSTISPNTISHGILTREDFIFVLFKEANGEDIEITITYVMENLNKLFSIVRPEDDKT